MACIFWINGSEDMSGPTFNDAMRNLIQSQFMDGEKFSMFDFLDLAKKMGRDKSNISGYLSKYEKKELIIRDGKLFKPWHLQPARAYKVVPGADWDAFNAWGRPKGALNKSTVPAPLIHNFGCGTHLQDIMNNIVRVNRGAGL